MLAHSRIITGWPTKNQVRCFLIRSHKHAGKKADTGVNKSFIKTSRQLQIKCMRYINKLGGIKKFVFRGKIVGKSNVDKCMWKAYTAGT